MCIVIDNIAWLRANTKPRFNLIANYPSQGALQERRFFEFHQHTTWKAQKWRLTSACSLEEARDPRHQVLWWYPQELLRVSPGFLRSKQHLVHELSSCRCFLRSFPSKSASKCRISKTLRGLAANQDFLRKALQEPAFSSHAHEVVANKGGHPGQSIHTLNSSHDVPSV